MKKIFSVVLMLTIILSFTACNEIALKENEISVNENQTVETNLNNKETYNFSNSAIKNVVQNFDSCFIDSQKTTEQSMQASIKELMDTMPQFTDEDILATLSNDDISTTTKITIIQQSSNINNGNGIADESTFYTILANTKNHEEIRTALIDYLQLKTNGSSELLEEIIENENGSIVMRAFIKFQKIDGANALILANTVIANSEKYNDYAIRGAITVKSSYFQDMNLSGEKKDINAEKLEYIDFCISKYNSSQDAVLKDSIVFSLMNMLDFNAVQAVVNHSDIDTSLKITCISRNYTTFTQKLNSKITKKDFDFILTAMEIAPIRELAPHLKDFIAINPEFESSRTHNIINLAETSNVSADTNILEKNVNTSWLK